MHRIFNCIKIKRQCHEEKSTCESKCFFRCMRLIPLRRAVSLRGDRRLAARDLCLRQLCAERKRSIITLRKQNITPGKARHITASETSDITVSKAGKRCFPDKKKALRQKCFFVMNYLQSSIYASRFAPTETYLMLQPTASRI